MKLQYLWDPEKTRKLYKNTLLLFFFGAIGAVFYTSFLPHKDEFYYWLISIPALFVVLPIVSYLLINKTEPGKSFLIFILMAQTGVAAFMALTGGFVGIVQFAPFIFLLFVVFSLGSASSLVVGGYAMLTFLMIFVWMLANRSSPSLIGEYIYYNVTYTIIFILGRNMGNEISVQVEARKKLEEVDDLKNQFITLTSHYLRTPLTIIKYAYQDLAKTNLDDFQRKTLSSLNKSTDELQSLIDEFSAISFIGRGKVHITKIMQKIMPVIAEVIAEKSPQAEKVSIVLHFTPPDQPDLVVPFDSFKIKQVVALLVDNSIKYNRPHGLVTVSYFIEANMLNIQVSDNGIGISQDRLETLFESFNRGGMDKVLQNETPGVGLSLHLAQLIVEGHSGKIEVRSTEGQGSTFTILLPLS